MPGAKPKIVLFSGGPKNGQKLVLPGDQDRVAIGMFAPEQFNYEILGFRIDGEEIWIGYPAGDSALQAMGRIFDGFMANAEREQSGL